MKLEATRQIAADRATVWAALLSPEVLKECVPGCQELSGSADEGFEAVVVQKVGPVKATFKGVVTLSDRIEGESLTLSGEGKGGAAGFAKGSADVRLEDGEDGGTALIYDVDAKVGGKLAQLGSRIIDSFARKMADQFFDRFQEAVEGPGEEPEVADEAEAEKPKGWFKKVFKG
ncbi:carbon monoxide dehydrogenase subunit G [Rhodobacteraceae bacterium LMO-12]|nr:carbon monoxide dehydrogenase subunit G [Rhodobacteraceae bacterium LMO-JJ12]